MSEMVSEVGAVMIFDAPADVEAELYPEKRV